MIGSAGRLEKDLREGGGLTAPAEVTAAKQGRWTRSSGASAADQAMSATVTWKLGLRVTPDGEEPFDAEVKEPYQKMGGGPIVGQTLGVLYDPSDHTRVAIDHSSQGQVIQALSHMSPEMQAALGSVGGGSAQDLVEEAMADPKAFREKMRAGRSGPVVIVAGQQVPGTPAAAPPMSPTDEIAKLADLRDRGALTDAEFQAQKQRVLGG